MLYPAPMIELKRRVTPLTRKPASMPPPNIIQPAPKRMPWAKMRMTPSIRTATKRIQKPAGRIAAETGANPGAAVRRGGCGNDVGGAPEGAPEGGADGAARSATHP